MCRSTRNSRTWRSCRDSRSHWCQSRLTSLVTPPVLRRVVATIEAVFASVMPPDRCVQIDYRARVTERGAAIQRDATGARQRDRRALHVGDAIQRDCGTGQRHGSDRRDRPCHGDLARTSARYIDRIGGDRTGYCGVAGGLQREVAATGDGIAANRSDSGIQSRMSALPFRSCRSVCRCCSARHSHSR